MAQFCGARRRLSCWVVPVPLTAYTSPLTTLYCCLSPSHLPLTPILLLLPLLLFFILNRCSYYFFLFLLYLSTSFLSLPPFRLPLFHFTSLAALTNFPLFHTSIAQLSLLLLLTFLFFFFLHLPLINFPFPIISASYLSLLLLQLTFLFFQLCLSPFTSLAPPIKFPFSLT